MRQPFRTTLLIAATLLMLFGAAGYTLVILPDLHGDLVEIGVRPTVLGATVLHLRFAAMAMFGFAWIVGASAVASMRGAVPATVPLAVIAAIQLALGAMAFARSHNPHHLGPVMMGVLIVAALFVPRADR